jgi:YVTN family beta-propeller protein
MNLPRPHRIVRHAAIGIVVIVATVAGVLGSPASATAPTDNSRIIARVTLKGKPYAVFSDQQGKYFYAVIHQDGYVDAIDSAKGAVAFTFRTTGYPNTVVARPKGKQLYVTQWGFGGSKDLLIVDVAKQRKVGAIKICGGPDGAALSPDGARLYVACNDSNTLAVVDTAKGKSVKEYPTGVVPNHVAVSGDGSRVYVTNYRSNTVTVIDPAADQPAGTIPTCDGPQPLAVSPDGTRLYVACINDYEIWGIDTATKQVVAKFPTSIQPGGVAVSPDGTKLYIAARDITVVDTKTNKVLGTIRVQGKRLWSIALSPDGQKAYASSWPNYVYIVDIAGFPGP